MPTLPPGSPNWVDLTYTPTWLFTPVTSNPNTVILHNFGRNTIYVGQANVTATTGFPIPPGSKPVKLTNVLNSLYAVSAFSTGVVAGTVGTIATNTAASTTVTLPAAGVTALSVGTSFVFGNTASTANYEVLTVATSASTTTVTVTTPLVFSHPAGDQAYFATPTYGQVSVRAGVL